MLLVASIALIGFVSAASGLQCYSYEYNDDVGVPQVKRSVKFAVLRTCEDGEVCYSQFEQFENLTYFKRNFSQGCKTVEVENLDKCICKDGELHSEAHNVSQRICVCASASCPDVASTYREDVWDTHLRDRTPEPEWSGDCSTSPPPPPVGPTYVPTTSAPETTSYGPTEGTKPSETPTDAPTTETPATSEEPSPATDGETTVPTTEYPTPSGETEAQTTTTEPTTVYPTPSGETETTPSSEATTSDNPHTGLTTEPTTEEPSETTTGTSTEYPYTDATSETPEVTETTLGTTLTSDATTTTVDGSTDATTTPVDGVTSESPSPSDGTTTTAPEPSPTTSCTTDYPDQTTSSGPIETTTKYEGSTAVASTEYTETTSTESPTTPFDPSAYTEYTKTSTPDDTTTTDFPFTSTESPVTTPTPKNTTLNCDTDSWDELYQGVCENRYGKGWVGDVHQEKTIMCFKLFTEVHADSNYTEIRQYCRDNGADVFPLTNAKEDKLAMCQVEKALAKKKDRKEEYFVYLGAQKNDNGEFAWEYDNKPLKDNNRYAPDGEDDCLAVKVTSDNKRGEWVRYPCEGRGELAGALCAKHLIYE